MKMLVVSIALMLGMVGTASAETTWNHGRASCPMVECVAGLALVAMVSHPEKSPHQDEPLRLVTEQGKGYSFTVAGEDYHAKKDRFILVK